MHILLTGSTGYIGKRLLPELIEAGHKVTCCVRDAKRFNPSTDVKEVVDVLEIDLLDPESLKNIPKDIDAGYYLVHSMSSSADYAAMELECAKNFCEAFSQTQAKQLIYLS